jgi:hypothetical protein
MIKPLFAAAFAALLVAPAMASDSPEQESVGATRDCIDLSRVTGRQAAGPQSIRFELLGGRVYMNELPGRCPGLRQQANGFGALAFEVHGGRICRGDRVRVLDSPGRSLGAAYRQSIPCPLGDFRLVEDRRAARN